MVNIENITRKEEERKLKLKRTKELVNKFFGEVYITDTSVSIFARENVQSNPFLSVNPELKKMVLSIPESSIPKYYEKALAFAREYEKKFNTNITLQTDYSK